MRVIYASMGRTGTTSIARLFKDLGINSHHQAIPRPFELKGHTYDLENPPRHETDYANFKAKHIKRDEEYFEASWTLSYYLYLLEKEIPDMKQIVCVRDFEQTAHSLWSLRRCGEINEYVEEWIELYSFVLKQIKLMKTKPKIIFFEEMIKGKYDSYFLDLFNLPHSKLKIVKNHWKRKINSVPRNESKYQIHPELKNKCLQIMEELKNASSVV